MPTPTGWRLLALGVGAAFAGRALGLPELNVLGVAAVAAVMLALVLRLVRPSRLTVERRASKGMVVVSDHVTLSLHVINRSRLRSPTVTIQEPVSDGTQFRLAFAPLACGAHATGRYQLRATRRGVLEIGPAVVDDVDGLGLARRRRRTAGPTRVIVHPEIEELSPSPVPAGENVAASSEFRRRSLGLEGDDFDFLRPYTSGDDPRHIHWRSTARLGDLMVRRYQPERPGRLTVAIDTRPPGDRVDDQDRTTSVAASIVSAVLLGGDEARVVTTDGRGTRLLANRSQLVEALEFLALLQGGSAEIDLDTPYDGSLVVAVSASPEAVDDAGARLVLARCLHASLVVTCGTGERSSPGPGSDPSGHWVHLTGPGQLGALWRMPRYAPAVHEAAR